jgi:hypothetical protein
VTLATTASHRGALPHDWPRPSGTWRPTLRWQAQTTGKWLAIDAGPPQASTTHINACQDYSMQKCRGSTGRNGTFDLSPASRFMLTTPCKCTGGRRLPQQSPPEASACMQLVCDHARDRFNNSLHAAADAASVGERPSSSQSGGTLCNCGRVPSLRQIPLGGLAAGVAQHHRAHRADQASSR